MESLFSKKEIKKITKEKKHTCLECGLFRDAKNPRMKVTGKGKKRILNIGGFMPDTDDFQNEHWQSKAGKLLKLEYKKLGIDIEEDCWNYNATQCYSPYANGFSITCCRRKVKEVIKKYKPHIIMAFGEESVESLLGNKLKSFSSNINKWRGFHAPDREYKAFVCPVFHPGMFIKNSRGRKKYVLLDDLQEEYSTIWRQDLKNALECLNKKLPKNQDYEEQVQIITDLRILENIKEGVVAFDYKTTGLKPYAKGHRIVSASVCDGDNCYAFMMPKLYKERKPFLNILTNPKNYISSHNFSFEKMWTEHRLLTKIKNEFWDSQLAAHILDNRKGITGLKFQSYVEIGLEDYSSHIDTYIKSSDGESSNSFNKIMELVDVDKHSLLLYNGLDSLAGYKLTEIQMKKMGVEL